MSPLGLFSQRTTAAATRTYLTLASRVDCGKNRIISPPTTHSGGRKHPSPPPPNAKNLPNVVNIACWHNQNRLDAEIATFLCALGETLRLGGCKLVVGKWRTFSLAVGALCSSQAFKRKTAFIILLMYFPDSCLCPRFPPPKPLETAPTSVILRDRTTPVLWTVLMYKIKRERSIHLTGWKQNCFFLLSGWFIHGFLNIYNNEKTLLCWVR